MAIPAHTYDRDDLALLPALRQAAIRRLFWSHGPATVRQVRQWLASDGDPRLHDDRHHLLSFV